mgnify:CR=1 FL=1
MFYLVVILALIVFMLTYRLLEIQDKLTEMNRKMLRQSSYFQSTQKWCLKVISKSENSAEMISELEDFIKEKDINKRYCKDLDFTMDHPEFVEVLMAKWIVDEWNSVIPERINE